MNCRRLLPCLFLYQLSTASAAPLPVPLFDASTPLEPAVITDRPDALITRFADRARDRHAREAEFHAYDHYLTFYWEERTIAVEIVDRVAKGGKDITVNFRTLTPLEAPEFRAFYRGMNTVAEYHYNTLADLTAPNQYSAVLTSNIPAKRPLQPGDAVEMEISQFIKAPKNGRKNYYGTTVLYVVGKGIVPWEGKGKLLDSVPLPEQAWTGGLTTLPYPYSDEPAERFKQMAANMAPVSAQPFMLGRRLHHTDFGNGRHSEPGNPVYQEQSGKLGPAFVARSCVACHVNNGRALPPSVDSPMLQSVVKTGRDAEGTPDPQLGAALEPQRTDGPPAGQAVIAGYTLTEGRFADGTAYTLRQPDYRFTGTVPSHFSVRLSPQLVGLGLLEAISESSIAALADPDDANHDGISGRMRIVTDPETRQARLGRFGYKASQATLKQQIAHAFQSDMGVGSTVFPVSSPGVAAGAAEPEIADGDLANLTRYVATLGISARRGLTDEAVQRGGELFLKANCAACHTPSFTTGPHHPLAELREQPIQPFTDLLLHDMGEGLADNMGEDEAAGREWRTAPLWSLGFTAGVSGGEAWLHDGRARSLEEAILWHGGEGAAAAEAFKAMPAADRTALVQFIKSL